MQLAVLGPPHLIDCFVEVFGNMKLVMHDFGLGLAAKLKVYLQNQARDNRNADAKIQLALLYFLLGGIRFQRARLGGDPDQHINIEQIATAALRLRLRGKDPLAPYVASWNEKIIEFERAQEGAFERFTR
jgi:hypothetical protein